MIHFPCLMNHKDPPHPTVELPSHSSPSSSTSQSTTFIHPDTHDNPSLPTFPIILPSVEEEY
ncbi:hypothetical protein HMI54_011223, partial [Coelomomyces lativittatus]